MATGSTKPNGLLNKCTCVSSKDNISKYPVLEALLPSGYRYCVCEWVKVETNQFECRFRVDISNKDEALAWFDKFMLSSNTLYNKDKTFEENTQNNVYKVALKCHHNIRPARTVKRPGPRHTHCPARLIITVKQVQLSKNYQSADVHLKEYPTTIILRHRHNHPTNYDSEKRFLDRLKPPEFTPVLKQPNGSKLIQVLQSYITKYNYERKGRFSELTIHDEENFSMTIVSPLMKRVLVNVPETSEVLFADSTIKIESFGCKLFIFLTNSYCGGLPVGCILTTSDCEDIFLRALDKFKSFLNSSCFDGRGALGPKVILTDDKGSGKNSFSCVFPGATVLVCTFRVLQAAWKFTMDDNTGIPRERRLDFFCLVKQMVYGRSKEQLARLFENITNCPSAATYPKFVSYVEEIYTKKEEWAKCFREEWVEKDCNTSNICESAMRMVHDNILKWKKATSVAQLFDYITSDIESCFETKLICAANDRSVSYLKKPFKLEDFSSEKVGCDSYIVRSTKTNRLYCVDSEIGICSCPSGKFGGMCKHQILVSVKYNGSAVKPTDSDPIRRPKILFIATGQKDLSDVSVSVIPPEEVEIQPQTITENVYQIEIHTSADSSGMYSENDEMTDNESMHEMQIVEEEIPSSPSTPLHWQQFLLTANQNREQEDTSSILPDGQSLELRNIDVNKHMLDISADSSCNNSYYSESEDECKKTEIINELKTVFSEILLKVEQSSETFKAAGEFLKSYCQLNTEYSLNSALCSFGKFCGGAQSAENKGS